MPLTPYGIREWGTILVVWGAAIALSFLFIPEPWCWWASGIFAAAMLAMLSFFRDPIRSVPQGLDDGVYLSPCDGTISAILPVESHEATGGEPAVVIRILLTVLNVHVNRSPCPCEVRDIVYTPGEFMSAMKPESAAINENNLVIAKARWAKHDDETIGIRQIAGKVARRIVCKLEKGQALSGGEKYGMIKFGSTTELILPRPDDVTVHVAHGQLVRGGKTQIATDANPGSGS